jgi:hypothetical protein
MRGKLFSTNNVEFLPRQGSKKIPPYIAHMYHMYVLRMIPRFVRRVTHGRFVNCSSQPSFRARRLIFAITDKIMPSHFQETGNDQREVR